MAHELNLDDGYSWIYVTGGLQSRIFMRGDLSDLRLIFVPLLSMDPRNYYKTEEVRHSRFEFDLTVGYGAIMTAATFVLGKYTDKDHIIEQRIEGIGTMLIGMFVPAPSGAELPKLDAGAPSPITTKNYDAVALTMTHSRIRNTFDRANG